MLAHKSFLDNTMAEPCKKCNHMLFIKHRPIEKPKYFKDILTSIWVISIDKPCILFQTGWAGILSVLLILFDGMTQTYCVSWDLVTEWTHYVTKSLEVISSNFLSCRNNKGKNLVLRYSHFDLGYQHWWTLHSASDWLGRIF